jgi:hypothetical protein
VDEDDGQPFYDSMMDWQDADEDERDEGAEDDYYEDLDPPYYTPGREIEHFDEFRMIKGFAYDEDEPSESGIFYNEDGSETIHMKNFRDCFSFLHEGPVNINNASPFLIKFLCGDDDDLAKEIMEGPQSSTGDPYFTSMNDSDIAMMLANRSISTNVKSTMFRAEINVTKGKANFKLHAILALDSESSGQPQGNKGKSVKKPRSAQNVKLKFPFRILSIRENENLVD